MASIDPTTCSVIIPNDLNIELYLTRMQDIVTQLDQKNNKDIAIERLDTLISELNIVINNNSGATSFPISGGGSGSKPPRKKKICTCA
jgi:hypothetical protein